LLYNLCVFNLTFIGYQIKEKWIFRCDPRMIDFY
jgi:hypothetical protein